MQTFVTFMLARGNHGYRDNYGRTAVHQLPWGYLQLGELSYLSTIGPTELGGPRGRIPSVTTTTPRYLEHGYDRVFVEFVDGDLYSFRDAAHKTELHRFSEL